MITSTQSVVSAQNSHAMSLFMSDDVVLQNSEVLLDKIQAWDSELTLGLWDTSENNDKKLNFGH